MSVDLIPVLLLSLLLLTSRGAGVETVELALDGEQTITEQRGALIVADADVTIPVNAEVPGPVHVIGGTMHLDGAVRGDVTHIAGTRLVGDKATIAGTLQYIGGTLEVAPSASVGSRATLDVVASPDRDPIRRFAPVAVLTAALAWVGARRARKNPAMLATASNAAIDHPLVSVTVGALVTVTFLSLFVFMGSR
jgi:hypothetical protein